MASHRTGWTRRAWNKKRNITVGLSADEIMVRGLFTDTDDGQVSLLVGNTSYREEDFNDSDELFRSFKGFNHKGNNELLSISGV